MSVQPEIESLSRRRQALWFAGEPSCSTETGRIGVRLGDLYEQKRHEIARASGTRRAEIVKQARVESELERLIDRR